MTTRQCPYCGIAVSVERSECPHCHAAIPEVRMRREHDFHSDAEIRKGLLYVLLAAVIYYFAAGYSAMQVPFPVQPVVTSILSPMLFLGGLGLVLHGYYQRRHTYSHTVRYR
jgi:hypothetical protein